MAQATGKSRKDGKPKQTPKPQKRIPIHIVLASSATAGVGSTLISFPFDVIKTRAQMFGELNKDRTTTSNLIKSIFKNDGIYGFYRGLSASIARQILFTGTRTGLFTITIDQLTNNGITPTLFIRCCCGTVTGIIGGLVGLPSDVIMTRMAADGHHAPDKRRNYKGLFNAFRRIYREEGPRTFFKGLTPTLLRAAVLNVTQLTTYVYAKENLLKNSATLICYPMEFLKIRMQVYGLEGGGGVKITPLDLAKFIHKNEGFAAFYNGLSASVTRQILYTGTRMGIFQVLLDYFSEDGKPASLFVKSIVGVGAGMIGGAAGVPPDICMVRMAADGNFPTEKRRNYKGIADAILRIAKEEGYQTLYRGFSVTVARAGVATISQLVSYVEAKAFFVDNQLMDDNAACHTVSSIFSALIATLTTLPIDIAKTRIQNMKHIDGKPEYKGLLDVWLKVMKQEGFPALWKGFTPMFLRNMPQFLFFFVIYEQCIFMYKRLADW